MGSTSRAGFSDTESSISLLSTDPVFQHSLQLGVGAEVVARFAKGFGQPGVDPGHCLGELGFTGDTG